MHKKKLFWRLFITYLLIILTSILFITLYVTKSLKQFYQEQTISELQAKAYLLEKQVSEQFPALDSNKINEFCKEIASKIPIRITVISLSGEVIGDSEENPSSMNNHKDRPEVLKALNGNIGNLIRYSNTLHKDMVYVSVPLRINNKISGVIRTSMPLIFFEKTLKEVYLKVVIVGLFIAGISAIIGFKISKEISYPLEELEKGAKRFAEGDLKRKMPVFKTKEINNLARAMNMMADQLDERIREIIRQNKEQEIILANMNEGIIAVDYQEKILKLNSAAAELLNINLAESYGKEIGLLINNSELDNFIKEALTSSEPKERNIVLNNRDEHFIKVYSSPIYNDNNFRIGTLIVLNDITRLKKLENIRKDFVANVSHELRTPVTAIKGFVETLLEADLNDIEETKSFLNIIKKHSDRLNAIIEDLLSISRLEQDSVKDDILLEKKFIKSILEYAIQACETKSKQKDINIKLICPDYIQANIHSYLLEEAAINLINNAINYSNEKNTVIVEAFYDAQEVIIKVTDSGCGMAKEHLPRIFERFYRVDKARMRKLGGTGLGLAIVKHIAQVHGGYVSVESTVGVGSTFYIHLPYLN